MMMDKPVSSKPVESRYAFDLDDVQPPLHARKAPRLPADLAPEDRLALGLTAAPATMHMAAPETHADAATALRDVLVKGGALGKADARRR